jgi:hypothetical protein
MLLTQKSLEGLWLKALLLVLFGYAVLGKGFAYLFIGETILVLGFIVYLLSQRVSLVFSDSILLLLAIFAFWGFCRTVPFLSKLPFRCCAGCCPVGLWVGYFADCFIH